MARTKYTSDKKQQLGQFMTPIKLTSKIVSNLDFDNKTKILEPSMGDGNFIIPIIDKFLNEVYNHIKETTQNKVNYILKNNLYGIEIDSEMVSKTISKIENHFSIKLDNDINFYNIDFFDWNSDLVFDYIIGNPPFGGTLNMDNQEKLDKKYGKRFKKKIKKETYSFFLIKLIEEHLSDSGELIFILSDTFMTIKTMSGLRYFLIKNGYSEINNIDNFSEETSYNMVVFNFKNNQLMDYIKYNTNIITFDFMELTGNFSWQVPGSYSKYFKDIKIGDLMTGSGGLTTGKNEFFVRNIEEGEIIENYKFEFYDEPITLEKELQNARYNKLSDKLKNNIKLLEDKGIKKKNVSITKRENPISIKLPHPDYKYYNKSDGGILYSKPKYAIYWKNDGEAVRTYKKNGRWHLRGMGGLNYYEKEGITWQFISTQIKPKYLPKGYILDNSGPILVLKKDINDDELFFILSWLFTDMATILLKEVINHTRNIQSKDLERLPYPFWVSDEDKITIINKTKTMIDHIINNKNIDIGKFKLFINKKFRYDK